MNKKILAVILIAVLVIIMLFSQSNEKTEEVGNEYDTSYYVEDTGNVFIKLAKISDKCCFYIVDIFVSGIGSVFNSILN